MWINICKERILVRQAENWGSRTVQSQELSSVIKLGLHEQFFTRDRNAIFRNYCVAVARKNCNPATRCDGKICWQINCQNIKSLQYFGNCSEDVALPPAQDMLHKQFYPRGGNAIIFEIALPL